MGKVTACLQDEKLNFLCVPLCNLVPFSLFKNYHTKKNQKQPY